MFSYVQEELEALIGSVGGRAIGQKTEAYLRMGSDLPVELTCSNDIT